MRALVSAALAVTVVICGAKASASGELLHVGGKAVKWASPELGAPATVTYAVLRAAYTVPQGKRTMSPDNCSAMLPFSDAISVSPRISKVAAKQQLNEAFRAWESVAAIKFLEVADARWADIVVGASSNAKGRAFANLSYRGAGGKPAPATMALGGADRSPPMDRVGAIIEQAYICLNPKARWKIGLDGNLDVYDLRYTFMHEIGHAIGLDHPGTTGAIMAYRYDERVTVLQESDIDAARVLYGPPRQAK